MQKRYTSGSLTAWDMQFSTLLPIISSLSSACAVSVLFNFFSLSDDADCIYNSILYPSCWNSTYRNVFFLEMQISDNDSLTKILKDWLLKTSPGTSVLVTSVLKLVTHPAISNCTSLSLTSTVLLNVNIFLKKPKAPIENRSSETTLLVL